MPGQEECSSIGVDASIDIEVPDKVAQDADTLRSYLAELPHEAKAAVEQALASETPFEPGTLPFVCLAQRLADAARREGLSVSVPGA